MVNLDPAFPADVDGIFHEVGIVFVAGEVRHFVACCFDLLFDPLVIGGTAALGESSIIVPPSIDGNLNEKRFGSRLF